LLWTTLAGTVRPVALQDPTRDVERFDAYRAALRDAVGGSVPKAGSSAHAGRPRRRRKIGKASK
jgi:hypothetical protein